MRFFPFRPWWSVAAAVVLLGLAVPAPPDGVPPAYGRARAGTLPLQIGVHAPNSAWTDDDFARVALGQFGAVKMMSYHPPAAYDRLRRTNPRLAFVVRLNTPWNELPPPEPFAAASAPYLRRLVNAGYDPWVEIGNEPNLELHPQAEAPFAAWYVAVLRALRAAVPEAKYGYPGLAQDQRENDWLAADEAAVAESDWLGVHAYWTTEREMLDPRRGLSLTAVHRRFPALPLVVTEAGNDGAGVSAAQRAAQYERFLRTAARLPYVRGVYFFILSGTPEWQRFFFDGRMLAAVREAAHEPVPVLDGATAAAAWTRTTLVAAVQPLFSRTEAAPAPAPRPSPTATAAPSPTPPPLRRVLLADPNPRASAAATAGGNGGAAAGGVLGRWQRPALAPIDAGTAGTPAPASGTAALRTASAYFGTDFSARLDLALPGAQPLAIQIADADAFAPGQRATGFALHWTGAAGAADAGADSSGAGAPAGDRVSGAVVWAGAAGEWRLQYRRAGVLLADAPLAGVQPPAAAGAAAPWYRIELALERRSAAAWVWPAGEAQPSQPNAVFAPPESAAGDGAQPRYLFLPDQPLKGVVLEGSTRA